MNDTFRSRVIFLVPVLCWKAEGDVSPGFGAGVAGLGFVLPRGPGSGEGAVAHKGSPPLLSGVELGGWSRGAWLLAPWARWRRRRVGGVGGRWAIGDLGPDVAPWLTVTTNIRIDLMTSLARKKSRNYARVFRDTSAYVLPRRSAARGGLVVLFLFGVAAAALRLAFCAGLR